MTEASQVWAPMREALAPFGHLVRVENGIIDEGTPDLSYCLRRVEGWVELKRGKVEGRRPPTLTLAQVIWIERRHAAGGRVYLLELVLPARTWLLYGGNVIRSLYDDEAPPPLVRAGGPFPTRAVLDEIAPLARRPS